MSRCGTALLAELADRLGLTRALSEALADAREHRAERRLGVSVGNPHKGDRTRVELLGAGSDEDVARSKATSLMVGAAGRSSPPLRPPTSAPSTGITPQSAVPVGRE